MDSTRRKGIGKFADHLRTNLGLTLPVDPDVAVKTLQGLVREVAPDALPEGEANVIKTDGSNGIKFEIWVDRTKSPNRRRFSIAHEIGHLFLHMGFLVKPEQWDAIPIGHESGFYRDGSTTRDKEFEAHEFAAAFLMPEEEYRSAVSSCSDLSEIAQKFEVSVDAALTRGRWLNIYSWT